MTILFFLNYLLRVIQDNWGRKFQTFQIAWKWVPGVFWVAEHEFDFIFKNFSILVGLGSQFSKNIFPNLQKLFFPYLTWYQLPIWSKFTNVHSEKINIMKMYLKINVTLLLSARRFWNFYFPVYKKAGVLEGSWPPNSLTPSTKKFDFQVSPLWFFITSKICVRIIAKYQINFCRFFEKDFFWKLWTIPTIFSVPTPFLQPLGFQGSEKWDQNRA